MNSKLLKSGHIKLYKRENSKYWQMKVKLPKLKAIRSSTGSKILKDAEKIALKYYSSFSSFLLLHHIASLQFLEILLIALLRGRERSKFI